MFSTGKPLSKLLYIVGLVVIFAAVYSQYFVRLGSVLGYIVVYGVPAAVATIIFGREILKHTAKNNKTAAKYGLGLFGVFTVLGLFIAVAALLVILQFDPTAVDLLSKPNPVLNVPPQEALLLIAVSFLVVGPAEEYLFRGFMFGGLLSIFKGKHWLVLAVVSGLMFAMVHAYYAVTYGAASVVPFIQLVAFGIAMSIAYYWSGGNLVVLALIHGAYDATGFLGVATTTQIGAIARGVLIAAGLAFAVIYLPKKIRVNYSEPAAMPAAAEKPDSSPTAQVLV
jgi:membrane protease YdiL (CAAX protease family)